MEIKVYKYGYKVDELGNVFPKGKNTKAKTLRPWKNAKGYLMVTLWDGTKRVHKFVHHIVLELFVGPSPKRLSQARHLDGDKTNNHITNLKWGTCLENTMDKYNHGTARIPIFLGKGIKSQTREWR